MGGELERIVEAYKLMATVAHYRPGAPGDGMGSVHLTPDELNDPVLLDREAQTYATRFIAEENTRQFFIGVSDYATNRAFVFLIEAARLLAGGGEHDRAIVLLEMAQEELRRQDES
jgi:hypothetical protein